MYVGPADGGFEDANEDVVAGNFGNGNLLEPQSGLGFRLYHCLHRFLHIENLSTDFADSYRFSRRVCKLICGNLRNLWTNLGVIGKIPLHARDA
jgi:hypothetical protein